MGLIQLLFQNPPAFFILAGLLTYSIILHEVSHGAVAYLFGDDTAKRSGRLSLNPVRHVDPMGLLMLFIVGFGWAKPVPVDFTRLKNFRLGLIFVSLAGCVMNILIATAAIFMLQFPAVRQNVTLYSSLLILARINIILGSFNLLPLPPLDGSKVVMAFLPTRAQIAFARLEPYGFPVLILLLFSGMLTPVIGFVQNIIMAIIKFILGG